MSTPSTAGLRATEHEDGLRAGRLVLPSCRSCGASRWYPEPRCPSCGVHEACVWSDYEPRGRLVTWTVAHESMLPGLEARVPYTICIVEVDGAGGARLLGNLDAANYAPVRGAVLVGRFREREGRAVLEWTSSEVA